MTELTEADILFIMCLYKSKGRCDGDTRNDYIRRYGDIDSCEECIFNSGICSPKKAYDAVINIMQQHHTIFIEYLL